MKTLEISDRRQDLRPLLELASEDNVVITTPGGRRFMLAEIDDFEDEVRLVRENAELMALLDARSASTKTITAAELEKRLGLRPKTKSRKQRRVPSPSGRG